MNPYTQSYPNIPKRQEEDTKWQKLIKITLFIIIWGLMFWQLANLASKGAC